MHMDWKEDMLAEFELEPLGLGPLGEPETQEY